MTTTENLRGVSGIYCAINRKSLECYVGSSVDIAGRRVSHIRDSKDSRMRSSFCKAIRKYGVDSFDFEVLERCDRGLLKSREDFWIGLIGSATLSGFNTCKSSNWKGLSEATRHRMVLIAKGRKGKFKPETLEKMRLANIGRRLTEEHKRKISKANKGNKFSEESRRNMSASQKGRVVTPEAAAKQRASMTGRKCSEEHRAKIRAGSLRRWSAFRAAKSISKPAEAVFWGAIARSAAANTNTNTNKG